MMDHSLLSRLKERKIVQWALAYAGGGWLVLEAIDLVADPFNISQRFQQVTIVALGVGFLATLVLAWYHGEKGRQRVSGMELLMLAALLTIGGGVLALLGSRRVSDGVVETNVIASEDPGASLAILPFVVRGSEIDQDFVDAFWDEIITRSSRIPELRVVSRTTMEQYRETSKDVGQIGRELNVRYVLEGALQVENGVLQTNLQLVLTETDDHIWSGIDEQSLDRGLSASRTWLASRVVYDLRRSLLNDDVRLQARNDTENQAAFELFERARDQGGKIDRGEVVSRREALEQAQRLLEEAIRLDPEFGVAYNYLSSTHSQLFGEGDRSEERARNAREALDEALERLPQSRVTAASAYYRNVERDFDRAIEAFRQQHYPFFEGSPPNDLGRNQLVAGRWLDAIRSFQAALRDNPGSYVAAGNLAASYRWLRRYDDAILWYDSTLAMNPGREGARPPRAEAIWDRDGDRGPLLELRGHSWWTLTQAGDFAGALAARSGDQVAETGYLLTPRAHQRGLVHLAAGDSANAALEFRVAADSLSARWAASPDDERALRSLGSTYALLGKSTEAVQSGRKAVTLTRGRSDAVAEARNLETMAYAFAVVGPADSALVYLDQVFTTPGDLSVPDVEEWIGIDLLRADPRFGELMDKYRGGVKSN